MESLCSDGSFKKTCQTRQIIKCDIVYFRLCRVLYCGRHIFAFHLFRSVWFTKIYSSPDNVLRLVVMGKNDFIFYDIANVQTDFVIQNTILKAEVSGTEHMLFLLCSFKSELHSLQMKREIH